MPTFIRTKNTTSKINKNIFISLIPIILFYFYKNGLVLLFRGEINITDALYPLGFVLLCGIITLVFSALFNKIFIKENLINYIKRELPFVPGLILGLIIPINTPVVIVCLSCLISIFIEKLLNKFTDKNLFNIITFTILIISIFSLLNNGYSYMNKIEASKYDKAPVETLNLNDYDISVKPYGNLEQFFVGNVPGEVSILFCLIGLIYLIVKKSVKLKIVISSIICMLIGFTLLGIIKSIGMWYPIFNILTGSIIFGVIYVASSNFTSPVTGIGQIIYGIILGILTVILRNFIGFADIFLAILICNILVPLFDIIGFKFLK